MAFSLGSDQLLERGLAPVLTSSVGLRCFGVGLRFLGVELRRLDGGLLCLGDELRLFGVRERRERDLERLRDRDLEWLLCDLRIIFELIIKFRRLHLNRE